MASERLHDNDAVDDNGGLLPNGLNLQLQQSTSRGCLGCFPSTISLWFQRIIGALMLVFAALAVYSLLNIAPAAAPEQQQIVFRHLATNAVPHHYAIQLQPNLESFVFTGMLDIDLIITAGNTSVIEFHSKELLIHTAFLTSNNTQHTHTVIAHHSGNETANVAFFMDSDHTQPLLLPVGAATLHLEYTGIHNDQLSGFYRSHYIDSSGNDAYLAVTQFEAADARRALPCWDEPAIKATFAVTLVTKPEQRAISNQPLMHSLTAAATTAMPTAALVSHTFMTTPVMSTYLLAFIVGNFDYVEQSTAVTSSSSSSTDSNSSSVLLRVYTLPSHSSRGHFALDCGVRAIQHYNDYFQLSFPLRKLDLLAIPDFAAGAMENWGAVTFRDTELLVQEASNSNSNSSISSNDGTSEQRKETVALVVCHELAHQWFGNFVTLAWWSDLWLNEGFATFMQYECMDALYPQWRAGSSSYVTADFIAALQLDSLSNSHAIVVTVGWPHEAEAVFDAISYSKGSAVLRMLQSYVGAEGFRAGIQQYLQQHAYSNADTSMLWQALAGATGMPVAAVMNPWTQQVGYPVLTVADAVLRRNSSSSSSSGGSAVTLEVMISQKRFLFNGGNNTYSASLSDDSSNNSSSNSSNNEIWPVPLSFLLPNSEAVVGAHQLLTTASAVITVADSSSSVQPAWLLLNPGATALHRTLYSSSNYAALQKALRSNDAVLCAATAAAGASRLMLINDAFAFARAGLLPTTAALQLAAAVGASNESDAAVWMTVVGSVQELGDVLRQQGIAAAAERVAQQPQGMAGALVKQPAAAAPELDALYSAFVVHLFSGVVAAVGWSRDAASFSLLSPAQQHTDTQLRSAVLRVSGLHGDAATVNTANTTFQRYFNRAMQNSSSSSSSSSSSDLATDLNSILPVDLRDTVFALVVAAGGIPSYKQIGTLLQLTPVANSNSSSSDLGDDRLRLLMALAGAQEPLLLAWTLQLSMSEMVRAQDGAQLLCAVAANSRGGGDEQAWQFVRLQWGSVQQRYGSGSHAIRRIVTCMNQFASVSRGAEIAAFFSDAVAVNRAMLQTVERIDSNAQWLERDAEAVRAWLKEQEMQL